MPDIVMLINYPYYKPINAKGYITREYVSVDRTRMLIPHIACETVEPVIGLASVITGQASELIELGVQTVAPPAPSPTATETPSAGVRGV